MGAAPPMRAIQFMISVSQPIIAATNRLVIYPPFLGGYLLSNFIQPVYRLYKAPVSDETPFAGVSPAISASQTCRKLSQPYRLFANDLLLRLLRRNLSLVASDRQLRGFRAGSLSRDLEDAKQSSSALRGESRPPSSQHGVSSPSKRFAAATPVQPGPSHPEGDPASAGPSRRRTYDSPSGSSGHSSRQGSDTPPRKRHRLSEDSSADERFAAAAAGPGPSVSWRQPYAFAPDQPTSNSSGRSFRQGG